MNAKEFIESKTADTDGYYVSKSDALIAVELTELETKISCYRATGLTIEQYDCMEQLQLLKTKNNIA